MTVLAWNMVFQIYWQINIMGRDHEKKLGAYAQKLPNNMKHRKSTTFLVGNPF